MKTRLFYHLRQAAKTWDLIFSRKLYRYSLKKEFPARFQKKESQKSKFEPIMPKGGFGLQMTGFRCRKQAIEKKRSMQERKERKNRKQMR
jgi:hypothetical protein